MGIFKRKGSELVDPQLTGLRFDQVKEQMSQLGIFSNLFTEINFGNLSVHLVYVYIYSIIYL